MLNLSLFNFFSFSLFSQILFFLIILILFYIIGIGEFLFKINYILLNYFLTLTVMLIYSPSLLFFLIKDLEEFFIIRDPNEFVTLLVDVSFFFTFIFSLPVILYFIYSYFISSFIFEEKTLAFILLFFFNYCWFLTFWIVDQDLFFSNWEAFSFFDKNFFDFQPEVFSLFLSFKGEFYDFFNFILILLFFYISFLKGYFLILLKESNKILVLTIYLLSIFYFFGGESYSNDILLLIFNFIFYQLFIIVLKFFLHLKRRKI